MATTAWKVGLDLKDRVDGEADRRLTIRYIALDLDMFVVEKVHNTIYVLEHIQVW